MMATGLLLEVAVLGVADEMLGTRLVALAVPLAPETGASRVLSLSLAQLPRHKLPTELRLVAKLPKYTSSKLDRAGCLALFNRESGS